MSQESAADLVDRMEKMGKTYFMDLPDDIHIRFFEDLDFPSRMKLRLNKRLDGLFLSVKNSVTSNHYELELLKSPSDPELNRLSLNTSVEEIRFETVTNEHNFRIIEALSNFDAEHLRFWSNYRRSLPPLNLSILHNIAQNIREVFIASILVSAQDLCTLRKIMLKGECKLMKFTVFLSPGMEKSFMKECFGVTIEEFYGEGFLFYKHFEDGLTTSVDNGCLILFKKAGEVRDVWIRTHKWSEDDKVQLNHLYYYY